MKPPAFAPAYVGMYVILAEIAREHGYALAVHGTVARDFDLIAIPWTDAAGDANVLIEKLREAVGGLIIPSGTKGGRYDAARGEFVEAVIENPSLKPHGRLAWNIHIDGGSAVLDVSVMPRVNHSLEAELAAAKAECDRLRKLAKQFAEANTKLRRIACHVPGRAWMKASEECGYGSTVSINDHKIDEAWLEFTSVKPKEPTPGV